MTHIDTPLHKNPCLGGHENYNFGRHFLVYHCYILVCLIYAMEKRRRFFKEIMHFHYMTYMDTPLHKNPCLGGHEIYNFGGNFIVNHCYILGFKLAPFRKNEVFKPIINIIVKLLAIKISKFLLGKNQFKTFFHDVWILIIRQDNKNFFRNIYMPPLVQNSKLQLICTRHYEFRTLYKAELNINQIRVKDHIIMIMAKKLEFLSHKMTKTQSPFYTGTCVYIHQLSYKMQFHLFIIA